jgi:branched-chain amino acid transport system permease protein
MIDVVLSVSTEPVVIAPEYLLRQLLNGLVFGSMLALMAVGFSLSWGVMRVLNFAHGAFFMLGGYLAFIILQSSNIGVLTSSLLALIVIFPLGIATERGLIRPLRDRETDTEQLELRIIAVLIGLWFAIEMGVNIVVGSSHHSFPPLVSGTTSFAGISIATHRLFLVLAAIILLGAFFASLKYTRLGMALRAVSQDTDTAELMGINTNRMYTLTFGVAVVLAAAAGVLLVPIYGIYPSVGTRPFLLAFIVVIIGGLGSLKGPMYAAYFIGLLQSLLTIWVSAELVDAFVFALMIVILTLRPAGIAGVVEQ